MNMDRSSTKRAGSNNGSNVGGAPQSWRERYQQEKRDRQARYSDWLEFGSDRLEDAWVSVCPHAENHDVATRLLSEVVDDIRTGGTVWVQTKWGEKQIDLEANQNKIRKLYRHGCIEADALNRPKIKRLLEAMGLNADPRTVDVVLEQPKGNTKLFYASALSVDGETHPVRERVVFHPRQVMGKMRANDAKKWTPGVTLAGHFLGKRDKNFLARATGLYPLDLDALEDLQAIKLKVVQDEHVPIVFTSITGTGLRVCVWGPVARDAEEYEQLYKTIAREFCRKWGLEAKLDEATYDCSRLCFLPYDPEITFQG